MRYRPTKDGDWIRPRRRGYRLMCCDCGLVHIIDFRLRNGVLEFRAVRDSRATLQETEEALGIEKEYIR